MRSRSFNALDAYAKWERENERKEKEEDEGGMNPPVTPKLEAPNIADKYEPSPDEIRLSRPDAVRVVEQRGDYGAYDEIDTHQVMVNREKHGLN